MLTAALDELYAMSLVAAGLFSVPFLLKLVEAKMLDNWTMVLLCFFLSSGTKALVVRKTPTTFTFKTMLYVAAVLKVSIKSCCSSVCSSIIKHMTGTVVT